MVERFEASRSPITFEGEGSHRAMAEWLPGPTPAQIFGRVLCFGSPVLAAVIAASCASLMRSQGMVSPETVSLLLIGNAALAALGSGVGAALRSGHLGVRIAGGFAYAILALLVYGIALGIGFSIVGIR